MENLNKVKNTTSQKTDFNKFITGLPIFLEQIFTGIQHALITLFSAVVLAYTVLGALSFFTSLKCQPEWNIVLSKVIFSIVFAALSGIIIVKLVKYIIQLGSTRPV